jgi:hypothetical protein
MHEGGAADVSYSSSVESGGAVTGWEDISGAPAVLGQEPPVTALPILSEFTSLLRGTGEKALCVPDRNQHAPLLDSLYIGSLSLVYRMAITERASRSGAPQRRRSCWHAVSADLVHPDE